jgi:hypothetical protein
MSKPPRDIGASVRARLLTLSRDKGQPFDLLLTRYAIERLLYRLSVSAHSDRFVLKGAMLMTTWSTIRIVRHAMSICSATATRRRNRCSKCFATCVPLKWTMASCLTPLRCGLS